MAFDPGATGRVVLVDGVTQLFNRLGLQRVAAMAVVAVLMLGFFLLFLALLLIRTRTEIRRRRLAALLARENRA